MYYSDNMNTARAVRDETPPIRPIARDHFTAPEIAKLVDAKLRQIQLWTDNRIILCVPGTQHQGRGTKRLYEPIELPIAMFASVLTKLRFPIGLVKDYADTLRNFLTENQPVDHYTKDRPKSWYRQALRGEFPSWIVCFPEQIGGKLLVIWEGDKGLVNLLPNYKGGVVINVREVLSPYLE